jgi:hypothetical protein
MNKILKGTVILVILFLVFGTVFRFSEIFLGMQEEKTEDEGQVLIKEGKNEDEEDIKELAKENWGWVNGQEKLYNLSSTKINLILEEIQNRFPNTSDRLKALSILRLNTPYKVGCLGEESGRDDDPIFRLDVADCTVFVLTNVALLHSQTVAEARGMMAILNYQSDSDITFENRLHFTINRNEVVKYFKDITKQIGGLETEERQVILNEEIKEKRLIDINWEKEITLEYIPNKYITKELFRDLPQAVGIAFIREGDEKIGLDIRHEGILFDGELFFHASSVQKKVVAEDFFEYYFQTNDIPRFDGITFFEIN